ncbi:MAG: ferredoxin--NADP reductase [Gemmataceae bacterium]|nr:ferredoxin--NADP reductase [Gemmataceae bacterium]
MADCLTAAQIEDLRKSKYNAAVVQIQKAHSDLMLLRVRPDKPIRPHRAGQYTLLGMGNWETRAEGCQAETLPPEELTKLARRSYSISHSIVDGEGAILEPASDNTLEFYIVLVRETRGEPPLLTPRLFLLQEGQRLFVGEKITGNFNLSPVKPGDHVVFFATGTGEAPHNYMTWELLRSGHQGKIVSASCVRHGKDLAYMANHEKLMAHFSNYHYLPLTTRDGNPNQKKYLQDLLRSGDLERTLGENLNPKNTHFFLCGNPAMIGVPNKDRETGLWAYPTPEGVIEILEKEGFKASLGHGQPEGNIHFEEYWS